MLSEGMLINNNDYLMFINVYFAIYKFFDNLLSNSWNSWTKWGS